MKRLYLIWQRFGRLVVVGEWEPNIYKWWYKKRTQICLCDCWKTSVVEISSLTRKNWNTTSCWCYNLEINTKHWMSWWNKWIYPSRFYDIYNWIKVRCNNKKSQNYKYYWWRWILYLRNNFNHFKEDMYESYLNHVEQYWEKETTIDRIDVNYHYCKENCKRSTRKEQRQNQRK